VSAFATHRSMRASVCTESPMRTQTALCAAGKPQLPAAPSSSLELSKIAPPSVLLESPLSDSKAGPQMPICSGTVHAVSHDYDGLTTPGRAGLLRPAPTVGFVWFWADRTAANRSRLLRWLTRLHTQGPLKRFPRIPWCCVKALDSTEVKTGTATASPPLSSLPASRFHV
jgi:hypothetical protein